MLDNLDNVSPPAASTVCPRDHHIVTALVENRFGALARIAGLFARRGYNIYSLAVSPSERPGLSRMTIIITDTDVDQVVRQLNKLIPVVEIVELAPYEALTRELCLLTVATTAETRSQVVELAGLFEAKVVDVAASAVTFMLAGPPDQLDALCELCAPYTIIELQRSGRIALPRLARKP